MAVYEYKVVPAPEKGLKGKGLKGPRERFANALQAVMNELGAAGWEYIRADTLPCEERTGLTGTTTTYQNMLVFRRVVAADAPRPKALPAPEVTTAPETAAEAAPTAASEKVVRPMVAERNPAVTDQAAAAAAAAALTAYREQTSGAPKLGPAPDRNHGKD